MPAREQCRRCGDAVVCRGDDGGAAYVETVEQSPQMPGVDERHVGKADQHRIDIAIRRPRNAKRQRMRHAADRRSEEHTSELQSLMRISYAVFCLKKKN